MRRSAWLDAGLLLAAAGEIMVGVAGYLKPQDVTLATIVALPFSPRSLAGRL